MSDELFIEESWFPRMWRWSDGCMWHYNANTWFAMSCERPCRESSNRYSVDTGVQVYNLRPISKLEFLLRTGRSYESTKCATAKISNPWGW